MQRDYKPAPARPRPRRRTTGGGSAFSTRSFAYGCLCGALLVVAISLLAPLLRDGARSALPELRALTRQGNAPPPPEFEFYTILPEMEVAVPDPPPAPDHGAGAQPSADGLSHYALQIGSFRNAQDADRLRAGLLLEDFPATVQTVHIDHETWYRVRVGPFDSRRRTDAARARLSDLGYRSLMLKLRQSGDAG